MYVSKVKNKCINVCVYIYVYLYIYLYIYVKVKMTRKAIPNLLAGKHDNNHRQ